MRRRAGAIIRPRKNQRRVDANTERAVYRFGPYEVDVPAHELRRQGERIRLQDQPFQVLRALLERAGQVVTRDELRQRVWPSSVFVDFDHGLNNAIARLREALGDHAGSPSYIETVPRIGYRFLARVESGGPVPQAAASAPARGWAAPAVGIAAGALLAIALLMAPDMREPAPDGPPTTPSIAVLPFLSLDQAPESEQFADGLTEELVSRLAGIRGLRVVARTSSLGYKGKSEPATAIAAALQVSHLLEGSVRQSNGRLRVTAQLVDGNSDRHLWSQTFDRDSQDIFEIQVEIARSVAEALEVTLLDADEERISRRGTDDPEAYRLFLIAQSHLLARTTRPDPAVAVRSLQAAIERDPGFAAAHAGLARYHFRRAFGSLVDTEDGARSGMTQARLAVELDPQSSDARMARANFEFWRHRFQGDYGAFVAAESEMQRAIALDPSNSIAHEDYGRAILWHAPDQARNLLDRAIQLDLLCTGPNVRIATRLGIGGDLGAARARCAELQSRHPEARICDMAIGTLEAYYGELARAIPLLEASERYVGGAARIQLWSIHMSAGDRAGALARLDFGRLSFEKPLSEAARHAMSGRYGEAQLVLERHRSEFPESRLLDLPTAKFALLAGQPARAREILEARLPDLARGIEPVNARNTMAAIDLATAWSGTGEQEKAREMLARVAVFLDGPGAPGLPLFAVQRARVHALAGEVASAEAALERAYSQGLRITWALDLRPQSHLYVDPLEADPALAALRANGSLPRWIDRIEAENAVTLSKVVATSGST